MIVKYAEKSYMIPYNYARLTYAEKPTDSNLNIPHTHTPMKRKILRRKQQKRIRRTLNLSKAE